MTHNSEGEDSVVCTVGIVLHGHQHLFYTFKVIEAFIMSACPSTAIMT